MSCGAKLIAKGLKWRVGDGSLINFWVDDWVPGCGKLKDLASIRIEDIDLKQYVSDFLSNGEWNVAGLAAVLPCNIVHRILSIHAGKTHSGFDKEVWGWDKSGNFSVKSAYLGASEDVSQVLWSWRFIWKLKIPPKILYFIWTLVHERILTNHHRTVRGMSNDPFCPRCNVGIESIDHLLWGCRDAKFIWENVSAGSTSSSAYRGDLVSWLEGNLQCGVLSVDKIPNYLYFACVLWYLWKWRCNKVFDVNFSIPQSPNLIIKLFAKSWLEANTTVSNKVAVMHQIAWVEPAENWVKLNIDGSRNPISGIITAGGVLRNQWKVWLKGFAMKIGVGSVIEAELWGLYEGLQLAWSFGCRKVCVETDSLITVQLMCSGTMSNHPLLSLIQSCKNLVNADWICTINHIYREGNNLADGLAHMGHGLNFSIVFYEEPPLETRDIFNADFSSLVSFRQGFVSSAL
ncbi:hypothetical protein LWI29_013416 [Acer saccharum]|uniref:RNase H type-1 domain-containing protein n=1 Tax=Acer saccharum TaxID=4024 RepID=A0AA39RTY7_ACESA|nr:hypothetical protein LWI29_013416 [Acer saccharum]